jgi:hypothetical protein
VRPERLGVGDRVAGDLEPPCLAVDAGRARPVGDVEPVMGGRVPVPVGESQNWGLPAVQHPAAYSAGERAQHAEPHVAPYAAVAR